MTSSPRVRYLIRFIGLAYIFVLLIVPVTLILWRTFQPGLGQFFDWVTTPAAISALNLTLLVVAIVVPLNVIFGIPTALVLARNRFRGKGVLQAIIDLPFAVSPVIVGVALIVLWGSAGALGFVEKGLGLKIIFGLPGDTAAGFRHTLDYALSLPAAVRAYHCLVLPDALMTRGLPEWQMRFDPRTLAMSSCLGWSPDDIAEIRAEMRQRTQRAGGKAGNFWWSFPAQRPSSAPAFPA